MIHSFSPTIERLVPGDADAIFDPISYAPEPSEPRLARLRAPPHSPLRGWQGRAKRLIDIVLALAVLLACALPILLVAIAIRFDSPGPVLFRQRRVGLHGRTFALLKFRTMYRGAAEGAGCRQATRHDPRITRLGHVLRCTSLDELPQMLRSGLGLVDGSGLDDRAIHQDARPGHCFGRRVLRRSRQWQ